MKTAIGYLAAAALFLAAAPASATTTAVLTRSTPTQGTNHAKTLLPLDDAGNTSFTFGAVGATNIFTFNAECTATGPEGSYVTINIVIDNHLTEPSSGKKSAFCSSSGSPVTASRVTTYTFEGHHLHTLQVYATGVGTASWRIDSSLVTIQN